MPAPPTRGSACDERKTDDPVFVVRHHCPAPVDLSRHLVAHAVPREPRHRPVLLGHAAARHPGIGPAGGRALWPDVDRRPGLTPGTDVVVIAFGREWVGA